MSQSGSRSIIHRHSRVVGARFLRRHRQDIVLSAALGLHQNPGPLTRNPSFKAFESPFFGPSPAAQAKRAASYLRAIDAIQSRGISVNGCFILGLDTQGPEVFEHVERFVERAGLTEVQVTVPTPFPGTTLYRRLAAEGRLLFPGQWERCTLFDVTYLPKQMSVAQLEEGLEHLMGSLYTREATSRRKRLFARNRRHWLQGRKEAA